FTTMYCNNASTAILLYDWLLCIDQEVAFIWKAAGGLNAGSLVYALSRFPFMMGLVINTATIFPLSISILTLSVMPHSCRFAVWAADSFVLLSLLSVGMFSAFRVYAVSGRKVIPTLVVSILSAVPIIDSLMVYSGFTRAESLPSPFNCSGVTRLSSEWTFSMQALLNMLQITLTAVSLDMIGNKSSYVTIFIDPISSILTCRFILNLRQVDHTRMPSTMSLGRDVQFAAQGSGITLPRFVASFGEPLHTASSRSESEESNEVEDAGEDSVITHSSSNMRDRVDVS
ncbi:hypothetical protein V8D89_001239, partial [Ganoderma adspersum]